MNLRKKFVLFAAVLLFHSIAFAGATAEEVYKLTRAIAAESKDDIWPGFDPLRFTVLKENALHFSSEPNNPKSMIFMRLSGDYFASGTLEQNIAITVHEAFHGFQRSPARPGKKWGYENPMLVFEYQGTSARNNALFAIEAAILRQALKVTDEKKLRSLVRDFLLVRGQRQSELDPRFVGFEKGAELNEGLAEYAGTKAVVEGLRTGAAKKEGLSFDAANGDVYLTKKYEVLGSIGNIGSNVRRKFYYTGSAQAFLLDRLMPGVWKKRVQTDGTNLQSLLQESVGPLGKLMASRSYEEVLVKEEKIVAQRAAANKKLLEETLSREGTKLTIEFSGLGGASYMQRFDPMNVTMIEPNLRVHTRFVRFGKTNVFRAEFNEPVVEDLNKKKYVSVLTGKVSMVVDGVEVYLSKDAEMSFKKGLKVTSENVEVEIAAGKLEVRDGEAIVFIDD